MKASTTYLNLLKTDCILVKINQFILISILVMLTIQSCQPTNKTETKDNMATPPNLIKDKKVPDSASLENDIQVTMFIEQTALGGMLEIALGKLAIDKAQDSDIKSFGKLMMQEYNRINLELNALASTKGLRLPGVLQQKQQRQVREMNAMKSDYFEKLYLKIVIDEHDKYIELFKSALNSPDRGVSRFAQNFLPVLETQRQSAYELLSSIRGKVHP